MPLPLPLPLTSLMRCGGSTPLCFSLGIYVSRFDRMKPTRQQVLGSLLLAAIVLIIFIVRARHILFP